MPICEDDMGLGKTLQMLLLVKGLSEDLRGPTLVVVKPVNIHRPW